MAATDLVLVTCAAGLVHIRLNSPQTGNALNLPLIGALCDAITAIDPATTRAVLITAEGRNFCVGGDLRGMAESADMPETLRKMATAFHEGLKRLDGLDAPVVTAINGTAAGGGLSLAIAGDIVLGGADSGYLMAYSAIGLSPDGGATYRLPRLIGLRLTQDMAYLNRRLDAAEAFQAGLITRVIADDALQAEALAIAGSLATGPTAGFGRIKRLLAESPSSSLAEQLDREAVSIIGAGGTLDAREGVCAFLERRPARFNGR
ncbi:enoyl-CoA hydratase/isomerase family protein [Novosphingobium sp. G106]|uniref:enoyl-CoA hydratase/isomerase family protein n=1 Tax=Novosphingobium sp. G106 TaxID=2849500 RepID=UPI001C2CE5DF|nr:enoyl-CoA hydratase-related protein [Novosphingobium sp. G106]MBV1689503.1 enoyl-CoA hydratase/isomerase family protein [Novosphingobium sp. G106]